MTSLTVCSTTIGTKVSLITGFDAESWNPPELVHELAPVWLQKHLRGTEDVVCERDEEEDDNVLVVCFDEDGRDVDDLTVDVQRDGRRRSEERSNWRELEDMAEDDILMRFRHGVRGDPNPNPVDTKGKKKAVVEV